MQRHQRIGRAAKNQPTVLFVCGIALLAVMAAIFEIREGARPVMWQKHIAFVGHTSPILAMACSPDGQRLASSDFEGNVFVWDWQSESPGAALHVKDQRTLALAFSPDGRVLVGGGAAGAVVLWDVAKAKEIRRL